MEARVEQFHTDAQRPKDHKTPKDIDKLRKFLYKNQDYRFTDREQSHLFQAVQLYVTAFTPASAAAAAEQEDNPAAELLEDALKMPFTVFTTSQKKTMLKWLDKFRPGGAGTGADTAAAGPTTAWYSLIDLQGASMEVMDNEGDTLTLPASSCSAEQWAQLQAAWEAGEDAAVQLAAADGGHQVVATRT